MEHSKKTQQFFLYLLLSSVFLSVILVSACGDQESAKKSATKSKEPPVARDYTKDKELYEKTMHARLLLDTYFGDGNNFVEASRLIKEVLNADDKYVPAYIEMSKITLMNACNYDCSTKSKIYDSIENTLQEAIKMDPAYADTYVLLGHVYALKDNSVMADYYLDKAERMGSKNPWIYINRAEVPFNHREYDMANEMYEKVAQLGPGDTSHQRSAYIYALQQQQVIAYQRSQSDRLLELAKKTVAATDPKDAWTWGNTASNLCREGFFDEGIEYTKKALSIMQYGRAYGYLSFCYYGKWAELTAAGQPEVAETYFKQAFDLDPEVEKIAKDFAGCGQKLRDLKPTLDKKIEEIISTDYKGPYTRM